LRKTRAKRGREGCVRNSGAGSKTVLSVYASLAVDTVFALISARGGIIAVHTPVATGPVPIAIALARVAIGGRQAGRANARRRARPGRRAVAVSRTRRELRDRWWIAGMIARLVAGRAGDEVEAGTWK